jgi:hypothetical protein
VSGLSHLHQGTRHKAWAKRQRADHAAVVGRTAVRPDGAGGVVRVRTENCMTLASSSVPLYPITCLYWSRKPCLDECQ